MIQNEIKLFSLHTEGHAPLPCTAPCTLLSVLLDGGYTDDPLYGENIKDFAEQISGKCSFSADVEMSGDALMRRHVYLRLEGIYASAEIFFNGRSYGMAYDPNRVYLFDVTDRVKESGNKLEIACLEPLPEYRHVENDGSFSDKYSLPPYLGDMGILGKCRIIFTNHGFISDVFVKQEHSRGAVRLSVGADLLGATADSRLIATLVSPSGKLSYGAMTDGICLIDIKDPEYWMPNGSGKPSLYKLSLTLYEGDEASDTYEKFIGIREVIHARDELGCPSISVGGAELYPLGATYIPSDTVLSRITKGALETLVKNAATSGMNALRVLGSDALPPEHFYRFCDKYGIMVYQDIAIPYIPSLATSQSAASTADRVIDALARIHSHPCVVFAGLSLIQTKGAEKPASREEADEFFDVLLKLISERAEKYTDGILFPAYAEEIERCDERYASKDAASLMALPSELSLESFVPDEDMNLLSPTLRLHGATDEKVRQMLGEMACVSRFPASVSECVYATNLTAAHLFSRSVRAARAASPKNTSGALCRQLNDGWPAVSASFTDWYGDKKAISYAAKNAYAPVCVHAVFSNAKVSASVINSSKKTYEGKLMIALYTLSDKCLFESLRDVTVQRGEVLPALEEDFSRFMKDGAENYYMVYELSDINGVTASGTELPLPPKLMRFCDPKIEASVEGSGKSFTVKLTSVALAPYVRVDFVGRAVKFFDNYVSVSSYSPVMIKLETDNICTAEELAARIRITSFFDIGNTNK